MKHLLIAFTAASAVLSANATAVTLADNLMRNSKSQLYELIKPVEPSFHEKAVIPSWKDNWFVNVQGGAASFIGSPMGCEDLFGRIKPAVNLSVGKWHTPSIGNRVSFQGFQWKSAALQTQDYRHYHADFLLNLTPMIGLGGDSGRFDIIPFVGLGFIDNRTEKTTPFALNYGVQGRFKLSKGFHITAELGNANTLSNADGIGNPRGFGDNLLSLSAGVSWTFGKNVGWKKVVDADSYAVRNEQLATIAYVASEGNRMLRKQNSINALAVAELKKILNIEGLLGKYTKELSRISESDSDDVNVENTYPINDYSGLNSLRKRLAEAKSKVAKASQKTKNQSKDKLENIESIAQLESLIDADLALKNASGDSFGKVNSDLDYSDYLSAIADGSECIGAPIYFFFELGTANLVDGSQTVNLDAIANVASKYGLVVEITGAADSATGTEQINDNLGKIRSQFVAEYLIASGVDSENIALSSLGGTNIYNPQEANRNCVVKLFLPE